MRRKPECDREPGANALRLIVGRLIIRVADCWGG